MKTESEKKIHIETFIVLVKFGSNLNSAPKIGKFQARAQTLPRISEQKALSVAKRKSKINASASKLPASITKFRVVAPSVVNPKKQNAIIDLTSSKLLELIRKPKRKLTAKDLAILDNTQIKLNDEVKKKVVGLCFLNKL